MTHILYIKTKLVLQNNLEPLFFMNQKELYKWGNLVEKLKNSFRWCYHTIRKKDLLAYLLPLIQDKRGLWLFKRCLNAKNRFKMDYIKKAFKDYILSV